MDGSSTTDGRTGDRPDRSADGATATSGDEPRRSPVELSQQLLAAVRSGDPTAPLVEALAAVDEAALERVRTDRNAALAFWINCYNAGTQLLLDRRPDLYESRLMTVRFFRATCLTVAGTELSLDDIEQGILRGSRSKYGLGYLPRLRPSEFERRFRLDEVDPRIHFALNCGAASCPPIRFYEPERIDDQLDLATSGHLDATTEYDAEAGTVLVPRVFLWYRGDFGGGSGTREFLREYDVIPERSSPSLRHRDWDWSRVPGKFEE